MDTRKRKLPIPSDSDEDGAIDVVRNPDAEYRSARHAQDARTLNEKPDVGISSNKQSNAKQIGRDRQSGSSRIMRMDKFDALTISDGKEEDEAMEITTKSDENTSDDKDRDVDENDAPIAKDDSDVQVIAMKFNPNYEKTRRDGVSHYKINPDLSKGKEKYSVPVFNQINNVVIDPTFHYSIESVRRFNKIDTIPGCQCEDKCGADCGCRRKSSIKIKDGRITSLIENMQVDPMKFKLIECRKNCKCQGKCTNRFTHQQIQHRIELDYMMNKGFGVRIRDCAYKGQFFCEYVGELLYKEQPSEDTVYQYGIAQPENAEIERMRLKRVAEYKKCADRRAAIREGRMTPQEVLDEIHAERMKKRKKKKKQRITANCRCCSPMAPWPAKDKAMSPPPYYAEPANSLDDQPTISQNAFEDLPSTSRQIFPVQRNVLRDKTNPPSD